MSDASQDPADEGMIRVVYLHDILLVRRSLETKSVDGIKADDGSTLADGE